MLHSTHRRRGGHRGGLSLLAAIPLIVGLGACDLPTELPKWDTTWVIPGESTTIGVGTLLPSAVSASGDAFALDLPSATINQTLGEVCPLCEPFRGLTVPKPAFSSFSSTSNIEIPGDVVSATLSGGALAVTLTHDFSFDPLRPTAGAFGHILVTATEGGVVIARDSIAGEATDFPGGATRTRTLPLAAGPIDGPITVTVKLYSPAGGMVTVDPEARLVVTATPAQVRVSEARVRVTDREVTGTTAELDLAEVDDAVADRVRSAALLLELDNPFAVTGTLDLRITAGPVGIVKQVELRPGTNQARVELDQQEIQAILGNPAQLSLTGTVTAPSTGVTVRPSQGVTIDSRFELTVGPTEEN